MSLQYHNIKTDPAVAESSKPEGYSGDSVSKLDKKVKHNNAQGVKNE
jgi:hypothetical protein